MKLQIAVLNTLVEWCYNEVTELLDALVTDLWNSILE